MKTALEMIEVMQHHINGGDIEIMCGEGAWVDISDPEWRWSNCDYRIKPKPPKKIKLLAWFTGTSIVWRLVEDDCAWVAWERVPTEDKVIEVEG